MNYVSVMSVILHNIIILAHIVSPGCSLSESVVAIVVGRSGLCSDGTVRKSNLFDSEAHSLKDDGGEPFGPHDFQRGVYAELVELYTSPSDWVLNLSIQSGKHILMYNHSAYCANYEFIWSSKILEPNISALKFQTSFCSRIEIFEHFNPGCSG